MNESYIEKQIMQVVTENPVGLTISEIARAIGISRNTVSKYLQSLETGRKIVHKKVAAAKLFFPASRINVTKLIDIFKIPLVVIDTELNIIETNNAFQILCGRSESEIISIMLTDIITKPSKKKMERVIKNIIREKSPLTVVQLKINERWYDAIVIPIVLENGNMGISIQIDIPEERVKPLNKDAKINVFKTLIESFPVFIATIEEDTRKIIAYSDKYWLIDASNSQDTIGELTKAEFQSVIYEFESLNPFEISLDLALRFKERFKLVSVRRIEHTGTDLLIIVAEYHTDDKLEQMPVNMFLNAIETMSAVISTPQDRAKKKMDLLRIAAQVSKEVKGDILAVHSINIGEQICKMKFMYLSGKIIESKTPIIRGYFDNMITGKYCGSNPHEAIETIIFENSEKYKDKILQLIPDLHSSTVMLRHSDDKILLTFAAKFDGMGLTESEKLYLKTISLLTDA